MRDLAWDRTKLAYEIRRDIWRFVSAASSRAGDVLPLAAEVLDLPRGQRRYLADLHLLLAPETNGLLTHAPNLLRHLTTSTVAPLDEHPDRVRGPIDWAATIGLQASRGYRHAYVTRPLERDYSTPENRMIVSSLRAVEAAAARLGWRDSRGDTGSQVARVAGESMRLLGSPVLRQIQAGAASGDLARVERGRAARRFRPVTTFWRLFDRLRLEDASTLQALVERGALVTTSDGALLEAAVLFRTLDHLAASGWARGTLGLVKGRATVRFTRAGEMLEVIYQGPPRDFPSRYNDALTAHEQAPSSLRPDLVLDHLRADRSRVTTIVEVKYRPRAADGARAALFDSLAYREAYRDAPALIQSLGVFWGQGYRVAGGSPGVPTPTVSLTSLDHLAQALSVLTRS